MSDNQFPRGTLSLIIVISLIVGGFAGALGSFFITPQLEKTEWGKQFLQTAETALTTSMKIVNVKEDSATIDVVKNVSPSVVSIVVTKELASLYELTGPDIFEFWNFGYALPKGNGSKEKKEVGGGTGFIIGAEGLILTNKHVVADTEAEYSVVFNDGKKYEAKILGRDSVNDIAVLKIEAEKLSVIELGDSDKIEIGQTVIAIGNALSEYRNTVTRGVISGINRKITAGDNLGGAEVIESAIQTDAAINPGNSGGPLLNLAGQVIGINTAVNWQGQSLGFAIPINQAKSVIASVKQFGKIVRPWIGVRYFPLNASIAKANNLSYDYGAMILAGQNQNESAVVPNSPAAKAGLQENDIILEINGKKLDNISLAQAVAKYKPGEIITLKVARAGQEIEIKVTLEERKE